MMYAIGDHVQYRDMHGVIRFICDQSLSIMVNHPDHKSQECRVVVPLSEWKYIVLHGDK
jgi:hypothetical protein